MRCFSAECQICDGLVSSAKTPSTYVPLESVSIVIHTSLSVWAPMCAESYKFVFLIMEEQLYLVGYSQSSSFYCSEGLIIMISCVPNVEMSTGYVLVTVKASTYLHSLQNVFRVEYALLPWVLEVLYTWISFIQSVLHYTPSVLSNHRRMIANTLVGYVHANHLILIMQMLKYFVSRT